MLNAAALRIIAGWRGKGQTWDSDLHSFCQKFPAAESQLNEQYRRYLRRRYSAATRSRGQEIDELQQCLDVYHELSSNILLEFITKLSTFPAHPVMHMSAYNDRVEEKLKEGTVVLRAVNTAPLPYQRKQQGHVVEMIDLVSDDEDETAKPSASKKRPQATHSTDAQPSGHYLLLAVIQPAPDSTVIVQVDPRNPGDDSGRLHKAVLADLARLGWNPCGQRCDYTGWAALEEHLLGSSPPTSINMQKVRAHVCGRLLRACQHHVVCSWQPIANCLCSSCTTGEFAWFAIQEMTPHH